MPNNFTLNITKKVPRDAAPNPPAAAKPANEKLNAIIAFINSISDTASTYQIDVGEYSVRGFKTAVGRVAKEHGLTPLEIWEDADGTVWARQQLTERE